ncbi:RNA-directed DNA polymerase, eukaryota [Tanacetum coccineum]
MGHYSWDVIGGTSLWWDTKGGTTKGDIKDFRMGFSKSKEDDVLRNSISVFVTNFPDHVGAKELWHACKQYGQVVDAYIPDRRSKAGKRFGFVRFIKVFDVNRLVSNLCTVWIGNHHLHANAARFVRPLANKSRTFDSKTDKSRINSFGNKVNNVVNEISSSYAYVAKGGSANNEEKDSIPVMVFDDTCNEGFGDIVLRYLGGLWVMIVFKSIEAKEKFKDCVAIKSWFTQIVQSTVDFTVDGRIVWVDVEGIPIKLWTSNSFKKIASKWGLYLNEEMTEEHSYHSKRLCILTKRLENIYETVKITYQGKIYWIRAKEISGWIPEFEEQNEDESDMDSEQLDERFQTNFDGNEDDKLEDDDLSAVHDTVHSEEKKEGEESVDRNQTEENKSADPFGIYELLKKKRCNDNSESSYKESLEFPPGFTPREEGECEDFVHGSNASVEVNSVKSRDNLNKSTGVESVGSDHFHKVEIPRSGGSILNLMEEVVKVGQTMGFKMDGCIKNIEDIVEGQGVDDETKMESIELFDIKRCWGNFAFDYVYSESSGNSGGILCVWNPNAFSKSSVTVSDYFIITRGVWRSNGKSMLIISVYAPQEISEKKSLWNYLNHVVNNWKGEAIIMGDFNEVRNKHERFGSIFNENGAKAFNSFIVNSNLEEVPLGGCSFTWCHSLKFIKNKIRMWNGSRQSNKNKKRMLQQELGVLDSNIDKGIMTDDILIQRTEVCKSLKDMEKLYSLEMAQKAKIKWAVEGDENSKYFHGILNKKRNQLAIRGVLADGVWEERPDTVKQEFLNHFRNRFEQPNSIRPTLDMEFPNRLSLIQKEDLEAVVSVEEIKKAVWDCGVDKSPGPDGIVMVLGDLVNEVQSAFIADRQILDGPFILNEVYQWCKAKRKQSFVLKIDFEKAYDSVRWDYVDDVLRIPKNVLHRMESIRSRFFNGIDLNSKKAIWVKWSKVLASEKGGLGVSRLSVWCDIIREVEVVKAYGFDLYSYIQKKIGNGENTSFWDDVWIRHYFGSLSDLKDAIVGGLKIQMLYQEQLVGQKSQSLTDLIVVTFLQRLEQESTTTSDIRPTNVEYESSWRIRSQLFFRQHVPKASVVQHHSLYETYLAKLEKSRKHGHSSFITSSGVLTTVLARERKNGYGLLQFKDEFSKLGRDFMNSLNILFEELSQPLYTDENLSNVINMKFDNSTANDLNIIEEHRFRVNEAKMMKLEEEKMLEISELKKRRMSGKTKATVSWVKINKHRLNVNDPSLAELLKKVKPWVEDLSRSFHSLDTVWLTSDIERFISREGKIKCKFPWSDDYNVGRNFWLTLVFLDPTRKGWLSEEHINLWVDYMRHGRPDNANWAMLSCYFVHILLQNSTPLFYANGDKYATLWSDVDQVIVDA